MEKKLIYGICATIILVFSILILSHGSDNYPTGGMIQSDQKNVKAAEFSKDTIAEHNTVEDCWVILHEKVYDVTEFLADEKHKQVIDLCGGDITVSFETRPMGSGTPHSDDARSIVELYYIGDLKCDGTCTVE